MSLFRTLFMGSPDFAAHSLQRVLDDGHFEVLGVISQPDRPAGRKLKLQPTAVKELALSRGLPVWTPETVNTEAFRNEIQALGAETAVVVAFGQILGQKFLDLFPKGCVNVHASLLPRWRGAAPIQRSLMAGDLETGVALQVMVKQLDAGPVLGFRRLPITDDLDAGLVHDQLKVLSGELLCLEYLDFLRGNLVGSEQDETQVTYATKLSKAEAHLRAEHWNGTARQVFNFVRGLSMGPQAWVEWAGQPVKILQVKVIDESGKSGSPGQVVRVSETEIHVACGQGVVSILALQPQSRNRMLATEFLRGHKVCVGEVFK